MPEIYRERIQRAQLVANPGCYPTSAILALAPLLRAGAILPRGIIVDSKSGVSGAGRDPKAHLHFPECNESVSAYGVGTHRHMPEIDQVLSDVADSEIRVVFTPHLIPMDRGILSTCYAEPTGEFDDKSLLDVIKNFYANERFVRATPNLPTTKQRFRHKLLRHHGSHRPRPSRRHQRDRQPRERRLGGGGAKLQFDARHQRINRSLVNQSAIRNPQSEVSECPFVYHLVTELPAFTPV